MSTPQFQPMSVGQILDQTFRLYREHFVRFFTIVAVVYVPVGLLSILLIALVFQETTQITVDQQTGAIDASGVVASMITTGAIALLAMVGTQLCNGALIKNVSEAYLGRQSSVGEAYRFVLPKIGTLIWASFLVGVVVMIGFILLIVPGVIFALWFALTTPAIVAENLKASRGMSRSKVLASGNLGKIFGTLFIVAVISWIVQVLFQWGGGLLTGGISDTPLAAVVLTQVFSIIGQIVAMPIGATAMILLYYDLRIRKEGFDLEMMAQSLGGAFPVAEVSADAPTR
ncbi:MAG: hypothetical protein AMXMBFR13_16750 [Phycisphaerae bacterium]